MQLRQIDYAPTLPGQKRRRVIRRVAFAIITVVLVTLAIKSAPAAWRHIQILYWQHQALTYAAPPDQVVYDDDPADATKVLASSPSLITGTTGDLFEFARPWDRFYQLQSPPGRRPAATLFLHERMDSDGKRRLVVVEVMPRGFDLAWGMKIPDAIILRTVVIEPGGAFQSPQEINRPPVYLPINELSLQRKCKWFAGQADATNPAHFAINGVIDGKAIQVDGWLRRDRVDLSVAR